MYTSLISIAVTVATLFSSNNRAISVEYKMGREKYYFRKEIPKSAKLITNCVKVRNISSFLSVRWRRTPHKRSHTFEIDYSWGGFRISRMSGRCSLGATNPFKFFCFFENPCTLGPASVFLLTVTFPLFQRRRYIISLWGHLFKLRHFEHKTNIFG